MLCPTGCLACLALALGLWISELMRRRHRAWCTAGPCSVWVPFSFPEDFYQRRRGSSRLQDGPGHWWWKGLSGKQAEKREAKGHFCSPLFLRSSCL